MVLRGFLLYKQNTLEEVTTTQTSGVEVQCKGLTPSAGGLWQQLQNGWVFLLSFQLKEVSKNVSLSETCRAENVDSLPLSYLAFIKGYIQKYKKLKECLPLQSIDHPLEHS